MSASRERFEAWAKDKPREFDLDIQTDMGTWPGQYDDYITQCAWEGWQAATAAAETDKWEAVRRCAEIVRTVKRGPFTIQDDATNSCAQNLEKFIKAEFPEAFK